jgi:hypothetical protein
MSEIDMGILRTILGDYHDKYGDILFVNTVNDFLDIVSNEDFSIMVKNHQATDSDSVLLIYPH